MSNGEVPRKTTPFSEAMVFVLGGGCFAEYQNLQDYGAVCATCEYACYLVWCSCIDSLGGCRIAHMAASQSSTAPRKLYKLKNFWNN
jgi:hypothetical protein